MVQKAVQATVLNVVAKSDVSAPAGNQNPAFQSKGIHLNDSTITVLD
jgi:hypothetical protein